MLSRTAVVLGTAGAPGQGPSCTSQGASWSELSLKVECEGEAEAGRGGSVEVVQSLLWGTLNANLRRGLTDLLVFPG